MQSEQLAESNDILVWEQSNEGILRLTLNDEKRRNALSLEMLGRLRTALDQAAAEPTVRVIVLAATGPAFCASHSMTKSAATPCPSRCWVDCVRPSIRPLPNRPSG